MFSSRRLIHAARLKFGHHPRLSRARLTLYGLGIALLFFMLWGFSAMGALRTFLPNTFQLIGWPGSDRTYLVIFQNNTELRATGGFITAYGIVRFEDGLLKSVDFEDVYGEINNHDYVEPPYPMGILLDDGRYYNGYVFRDANFEPDFDKTVEDLLELYALTDPDTHFDGVFAVNFSVLEDLVGLYEPVQVDGLTLTRDNLFESLETAVSDIDRHSLDDLSTRKNIIGDFAQILLKKMALTPWKWRELSEVLTQNLNEKEILLNFENRSLAKKTAHLEWDGTLPQTTAREPIDRLVVNLSNFGGLKSDRYLTRDVTYIVNVTGDYDEFGNPLVFADLEVNLRHHGDYNPPLSGTYYGYLRVFLPEGAELLESSTDISTEETIEDYTGWGDLIELNPGENVSYSYRFRLSPDFFLEDGYRLTLIKQPGTADDLYQVIVKAPRGMGIASDQFENRENVAIWSGTLDQDTDLELDFLTDVMGPRLFYHEIEGLNVIELIFAEDLDPESAEDPLNWQITDLNITDATQTDNVQINFIQAGGGNVTLYTRGMNPQEEEFYEVFMRNIRDLSGNYIRPNPRTVTVVQRLVTSADEANEVDEN